MKQNIEIGNLSRIKKELERRLTVMRYSEVTVKHYMYVFGWLEDFLGGYGEKNYSKEAGKRFIAEYRLQVHHTPTLFKCARTVVRRIDEILENKVFTPNFRKSAVECPPSFTDWRDKFFDYLANQGIKKSTIKRHKIYVERLFVRLEDMDVSLEKLTASDVYSVFTRYEWPLSGFVPARALFVFLFENGATKTDLSGCVPKPRRPQSLPSVYSKDEVAKLLLSVDRTTCLGKRDYAILTLAANLGLRSSDIVNLSFKDIDHTAKTIKIVQVKTSRPLTLVLNGDVEDAINDYIQNGRSQSSSEKIFLRSLAPYMPLTASAGHTIANKYFAIAGIAPQGRKRGTQALRMSYATALVAKGVPYAVVQKALGHDDPESSKHYVRVDVRRLRICAITVPPPTGAFAVSLGDLEGVL